MRPAFEEMHQVAGSVGEDHEVACFDALGEGHLAPSQPFAFGAIGAGEVAFDSLFARAEGGDHERVKREFGEARSGLGAVHLHADHGGAGAVALAKGDAGEGHAAAVQQRAPWFAT